MTQDSLRCPRFAGALGIRGMMHPMGWLWRDVRYAFRDFLKQRGFVLLAVLTLGLGIGSVSTIYSVIWNVLIDPFPYKNSGRYVDLVIRDTTQSRGGIRGALPIPEFLDYKEQSTVFEDIIGTAPDAATYRSAFGAERITLASVTPNLFDFLGTPPALGRTPTAHEIAPGAAPVAVLSWKMWMNRFSADPGVIGRTLVLDDRAYTIVAVMPPRFTWHVADVWVPRTVHRTDPDAAKPAWWFQATLKPGVTTERAMAEMNSIAAARARIHPGDYPKRYTMQVLYVIDWVVGQFRGVLYSLFGAVALLLLIACCNVANMMLARGSAREREITIRAALGAGRWQIVRQLLVESALLSIAGAAAGCLIAWAAITLVARNIPPYTIPFESAITLNRPVLLFSLIAAMLTPLLFGLVPAMHSTRRDLVEGLRSRGQGDGFRRGRLRSGLIISEIALSMVLLVGAGLLMRTFISLAQVDLGFQPEHLLIARFSLPDDTAKEPAGRMQAVHQAVRNIAALPGIAGAAVTMGVPPFGGGLTDLEIPGQLHPEKIRTMVQFCGEDYFRVLGVRVTRGRPLSADDVAGIRRIVVVNETFARKYFGEENPLGRSIRLPELEKQPVPVSNPIFEIAGVSADMRNEGLQEPPMPEAFLPWTTVQTHNVTIVARSVNDPSASIQAVRRAVGSVDDSAAINEPQVLEQWMSSALYARPRFTLTILGAFAGVGLLLVAIGVYSVMAYTVTRQTREIGIRMAIGARRADVLRMVLRMCAVLLAVGAAAGILISLLSTRIIASQLWNVSPHDPVTIAAAAAVIALAALGACLAPALRATRIDPATALKEE